MKQILLVEDEQVSMMILGSYLRQAGYQVDEAENGEDALQKLNTATNYDLVVTDRRMPVMDGLELFTAMQRDLKLNHLPVIMQTAANAPHEDVEGIKAGVYYYLTKPYDQDTLLNLVQTAIRDREQQTIFEQRLTQQKNEIGTFLEGEFQVQSIEEAQNIAFLLGGLFPRPELAVPGLYELLVNAIEHGNLGISYDEKGVLLADDKWENEIHRRLTLPQYKDKRARVHFRQGAKAIDVTITDQGAGFDWRPFMQIEPARATQNHGRGIAKANQIFFDAVTFTGNGNVVKATTNLGR